MFLFNTRVLALIMWSNEWLNNFQQKEQTVKHKRMAIHSALGKHLHFIIMKT